MYKSICGYALTFLMLCTISSGQAFMQYERIPSLSDEDFTVERSISGPIDHSFPKYPFCCKRHWYYSTTVKGAGILESVSIVGGCGDPNARYAGAIITVNDPKQNRKWTAAMNGTACFTEGVQYWKAGDVIIFNAQKIIMDNGDCTAQKGKPSPTCAPSPWKLPDVFDNDMTQNTSRNRAGQPRMAKN